MKYINISDKDLAALARCFLPFMQEFFESEEGRREFEGWKRAKERSDEQENADTPRAD